MKLIKKILIAVLSFSIFGFVYPNTIKASSAGFYFNNLDVVVDVNEDGVFKITETYDTVFEVLSHGIFINLPTKYSNYSWDIDGKQIIKDYFWPISDIDVSSADYLIDRNDNGVTIRIGNANHYARENETYKISYKIHSRDLDLDGIQVFYVNLVSDKWQNKINKSTFTINMPKSFDASNLTFYTDGHKVDPALKYEVNGNTITGSLDTPISYGRGITVKLDLPNDYFNFTSNTQYQTIAIGAAFLMLVMFTIIWMLFGRDDEVIITVEFEPPKGISSAGVGYIFKGYADNKDIASLFLEWANKGFITIKENNKQLLFSKVKDISADENPYSKVFFEQIFSNGITTFSTKSLKYEYYSYENARNNLESFFQDKNNGFFSKTADTYQLLFIFLAVLPISITCGYTFYLYTYDAFNSLGTGIISGFSTLISVVLATRFVKRINGPKLLGKLGLSSGAILFLLISFGISIEVSSYTGTSPILFYILWTITIINIIIVSFMPKRTKYGTELLGKVLGLKDFIEHAEKDRINMLFEENPQIYYNVLPYAYVLGLTSVWESHFSDMEMIQPEWYIGDSFIHDQFYSSMNRTMASVSSPPSPSYTSSSSSGGGGSFSRSGGRGTGSSGGGFGGSSGGRW